MSEVKDVDNKLEVKGIEAPTEKGDGPRGISRFKPDSWMLALSKDEGVRMIVRRQPPRGV